MPGILYHSAARIVQQLLIDLGLATDYDGADSAWPSFLGVEPPTPNNVLTLFDTEGRIQGRLMNDGEVQDKPGVQIRIRNESVVDGYVKGRAILNGLDTGVERTSVIVDEDQYTVQSLTRTTDVLSLGLERGTGRRWLHTINYVVSYRYVGSVGTGS